MNKKILIAIAVIVVIVIVGFMMKSGDKALAPDSDKAVPTAMVDDTSGDSMMESDKTEGDTKDGDAMMEEGDHMMMESDLEDGSYTINTSASTLSYSASRLAGTPHTGTVDIKSGNLDIVSGSATGEFVIDMTTITDSKDNERYLGHIKSDDFFGVEEYPESKLQLTNIESNDDGTYTITGYLTIRDETNQMAFPATITQTDSGLTAQAEFNIDRTRWDITFDSGSIFLDLGDRAIRDEISYTLDLTFDAS